MICIISLVAFAYSKQLTAAVTLYFTLFAFWCVLKHLYTDLREKTSCVVHLQHATGSGRVFSGFGVSLIVRSWGSDFSRNSRFAKIGAGCGITI